MLCGGVLGNAERNGASSSDGFGSYQDTHWGSILPLCRNAVGIFYNPSQLSWLLPDDCHIKMAWNQWLQISIHAIKPIWKLIYIYLLVYYIIALSQILSILQIILHLVCHKPTKWDSENHILFLYIYMYIFFEHIVIFLKLLI